MNRFILVLMLLPCLATATVEDSGGGIGTSGTGGYWPTPSLPDLPPQPVIPTHLEITMSVTGPAAETDKGYTTPGKCQEYLITVTNDGSSEVTVELSASPGSFSPSWFSWTTKEVAIPGGGSRSEVLCVKPEMGALAGSYDFEVRATAENVDPVSSTGSFKVQDYDYASETAISGTGQFQLNKDVRSMNSGIKSNKDVYFSGSVDALVKNEYLVDSAKGRNPNFEEQDVVDNYLALNPGDALFGTETLKSSIAFGGIGARVTESYNLQEMEFKNQNFNLYQTGTLNKMAEFKTADNFTGYFLIDAKQSRPGQKSMKEHEEYMGSFEIQRRLLFKERPTLSQSCFGGSCDFMNNLNAFVGSA